MVGVIYARYSAGPRQTDQSIEGQVAECTEYAERNGIDIAEVYADRHVSGKRVDGRWEFQRMLKDAQAHKFQVVIVWKIDRFGRNREDIAIAKMTLRRAGVKLMYAAESVPEGPEGIMLETVLEGLAEFYSAELRQKITRGLRENMKKGLTVGGPLPIGYKSENHRVAVDPETAPLAREVFERYDRGEKMQDIVAFLNDHNVHGARGAKATPALVYRMLRNPRYLGIFDQYDIELRVEPIISEELFESVAMKFPKKRQNAANKALDDYKLSCKCFCGYCGAMLVGECGRSKSGVVYRYYKCAVKKRGGRCELATVPRDLLEKTVLDATVEDMLNKETLEEIIDGAMEVQANDEKDDPVALLQKQLEQNRRKRNNLILSMENCPGSPTIANRLSELEKEASELEKELVREKLRQPHLSREILSEWLYSFKKGNKSDPEYVARIFDTFVAKVAVFNDKIVIYYNITDKESPVPEGVRIRTIWWSIRDSKIQNAFL